MKHTVHQCTITFCNKKHERKHFLITFVDEENITTAYIFNNLPTEQKDEIYLVEDIETKKTELEY